MTSGHPKSRTILTVSLIILDYLAIPHLQQEVFGLGAPLAVSHQLLLTFPAGEEDSSESEWHYGNTLLHFLLHLHSHSG